MKGGGIGILLLALVGMYFGIDPSVILDQVGQMGEEHSTTTTEYIPTADENQLAEFVSVVLADTEDTWKAQFSQMGSTYVEPRLVLFTGAVESACGFAQAAMGPFYCPADQKVYIDLGFYQDLKNRMNSPGDFAQAYVIAHEVGHHVQNLLGISDKVQAARGKLSEKDFNQLSVRLELQADCLAGVWAMPTGCARLSNRGISMKLSTRPARSAMTGCRNRPAVMSRRIHLPTGRRSKGSTGLDEVSVRGI
jgi:hypothetical protein